MKSLARLILAFVSNLVAFLIAGYLVNDFIIVYQPINLIIIAALFTAINFLIKPVVKTILSPLVILTLGLFSLVINAGMLLLVDILSQNITINGLIPLIYATLIISVINILISLSAKFSYPK